MNKLTIKKACELAGISRPTLYKYINDGKLSIVKDINKSYIDLSELIRIFPNISLQETNNIDVNNLQIITGEIAHKDELIKSLKQQLEDKQRDNNFLKEQLTQVNQNFTQFSNLLEDKTKNKRKKIFGLF